MDEKMILAGLVGLLTVLVAAGGFFWEEPEESEDGQETGLQRFQSTREMMDTYVKIIVYHADEEKAVEAMEAAFGRMKEIEAIASRFNSSSEVHRLNTEGTLEKPSPELVEMIETSIHYWNLTGGAFDITILPLLNLWSDYHDLFAANVSHEEDLNKGVFPEALRSNFTDFRPSLYELNGTPTVTVEGDVMGTGVPGWTIRSDWQEYYVANLSGELRVFTRFWYFPYWSQQEFINQTMPLVGPDKITVTGAAITLVQGMSITLDGMAKGYAVDAAIKVLEEKGVAGALVDAGGDIATLGTKPGDQAWVVGLRNPENKTESVTEFGLSGQAVATSGNYERYFNETYDVGHIMDPGTGRDVFKCSSSTIIADNCTVADLLATAVFVLGTDDGIRLVDTLPGTEALLLGYEDPGEFFRSSGLDDYELRD